MTLAHTHIHKQDVLHKHPCMLMSLIPVAVGGVSLKFLEVREGAAADGAGVAPGSCILTRCTSWVLTPTPLGQRMNIAL